MIRSHGKVDANQEKIVRNLRMIPGVKARSTASLSDGFPDIIVGHKGRNWLFEIKDPKKSPSQRLLTEKEVNFMNSWTGQYNVVLTIDEILKIIGVN